MSITGHTAGLAPSERKLLERVERRRLPLERWCTPELLRDLAAFSHGTGRQLGVLADRSGRIVHVVVGDAAKLVLPDLGRHRAGAGRLRGLRLVHTHLSNEPLSRDDLVDLTRLRLDLVLAVCLDGAGRPRWVYYAYNVPGEEAASAPPYRTVGPLPPAQVDLDPARLVPALEEEFARARRLRPVQGKDGRAILVHVCEKRRMAEAEASLAELSELARTAGVEVADRVLQARERVDPKYVLGRGKVEEVVFRAMQLDAEVLVFDRNLTPAQAAAVSRLTDMKVIDRTQLILDIFAQHATTREGKLQVELAQMKYLLPRLGSKDDALSRLTGGIGGRGPGETKLEIGRRRARERIARLQRELRRLQGQRLQRRGKRRKGRLPLVAVVGYTNAGKTTLLGSLVRDEGLRGEDKLFATLEPRSRRVRLPSGRFVILSDTVGFVRELPEDLFEAFRATFEEATDASVLLLVVDASDPAWPEQLRATDELLGRLGLEGTPRLLLYNKTDRLSEAERLRLRQGRAGHLVSALRRASLRPVWQALEELLAARHGPPPAWSVVPEGARLADPE